MTLSQNDKYLTIQWDILNLEAKGKIKVNNSYSTVKYLVNYIEKHTNHLIEYVIINNEDIDADDAENRIIDKITFVSYYVDMEQRDIYPDQKFYKLGLLNLPILKKNNFAYEKNIVKIIRSSDDDVVSVCKYIIVKFFERKYILNFQNAKTYLYAYINMNTKQIVPINDTNAEDVERVLISKLFIPAISLDPEYEIEKKKYHICLFEKDYEDCCICLTNKSDLFGFCCCKNINVCESCITKEKVTKCPMCDSTTSFYQKVSLIK